MTLLLFYLVYPLGLITAIILCPILYTQFGIPLVEALNFPADISTDATAWSYHGLSLLFFREPPYPAFFPERVRELGYFTFLDQLVSYIYLGILCLTAADGTYAYAIGLKDSLSNLSTCRFKLAKYRTRPQVARLFHALERSVKRYTLLVLTYSVIALPLAGFWAMCSMASLFRGQWAAFFWCAAVVVAILLIIHIVLKVVINAGELVNTTAYHAEEIRRMYQDFEVAERELEVRQAREA